MNITSARRAAEFVRSCSVDANGKLEVAVVPGHEARLYQVLLRRVRGVIHTQCHNPEEGEICKGNRHSICFHSLAAVIFAAGAQGLRVRFCRLEADARRISHTGGTVVPLVSDQSRKGGWLVCLPAPKARSFRRGAEHGKAPAEASEAQA